MQDVVIIGSGPAGLSATTRCEMPLDMMSLGVTIKEGWANGTNQQRSLLSQHC